MEPYKAANIRRYSVTHARAAFRTHPSKIVAVEAFRRRCRMLAHPHELVLDIGGGPGVWMDVLMEEGIPIRTVALDISLSMLKERSLNELKVCGDMETLPFADNVFDRAFFLAALHHVRNTKLALAEAKRVVRPGGHIVLAEPTSLRILISGRGIEQVDEVEFRMSYRYLLQSIREVGGMRIVNRWHRGIVGRIAPRAGLRVRRWLDRLDELINGVPGLRWFAVLGSQVTLVVQKSS